MAKKPDSYYHEKYEGVKANVPKRRKAYVWIIVLAIIAVAIAAVDIFVLDEPVDPGIQFALYGILAILFIWAIILLFAGREMVFGEIHDLEGQYLRCPTCRHVFGFDMEHQYSRKGVTFTCPECGAVHGLPPPDREPEPAMIPGGDAHGPDWVCTNCSEHFTAGALGHGPKASVHFDACPYCGENDTIKRVGEH